MKGQRALASGGTNGQRYRYLLTSLFCYGVTVAPNAHGSFVVFSNDVMEDVASPVLAAGENP